LAIEAGIDEEKRETDNLNTEMREGKRVFCFSFSSFSIPSQPMDVMARGLAAP